MSEAIDRRPGRDRDGPTGAPADEQAAGPTGGPAAAADRATDGPSAAGEQAASERTPEVDAVLADDDLTGPELARAVLDAARANRPTGRRRSATGPTGSGDGGRRTGRSRRWSGPGPDPRDPQPFGTVLAKLLSDRGWQRPVAEATLFSRWEQVVGAEVAERCRPVKLAGGELTLEAVSTAWATQLRLLAGKLLRQIALVVGHGVVTRLRIHGPAAPSWQRGPLRVPGPGPRDTYG